MASPSWWEKVVYRRKAGWALGPAEPRGHGSKGTRPVNRRRPAPRAGLRRALRLRHPGRLEHFPAVLELLVPAAVVVACSIGFALWTRTAANARVAAAVRDLSAGLGWEAELASSLDPEEVTERVLAAAAALPGIDGALLVVHGEQAAVGLGPGGRAGDARDPVEHEPALAAGRLPLPPGRGPRAPTCLGRRSSSRCGRGASRSARSPRSRGPPRRSSRTRRPTPSRRSRCEPGRHLRTRDASPMRIGSPSSTRSPVSRTSGSSTSCSGARSCARGATGGGWH